MAKKVFMRNHTLPERASQLGSEIVDKATRQERPAPRRSDRPVQRILNFGTRPAACRSEGRRAVGFLTLLALVATFWIPTAAIAAVAESPAAATNPTNAPILWAELGAKATAQYSGDGLAVFAGPDGAVRLRCGFQKLEGEVTPTGLWLTSTVADAPATRFRVMAESVGREVGPVEPLAERGTAAMEPGRARWERRGLLEGYSVSAHGVRGDLVVAARPEGLGDLRVDLGLPGARAEANVGGAKIILKGSQRELVYNQLWLVDAGGRELGPQ